MTKTDPNAPAIAEAVQQAEDEARLEGYLTRDNEELDFWWWWESHSHELESPSPFLHARLVGGDCHQRPNGWQFRRCRATSHPCPCNFFGVDLVYS